MDKDNIYRKINDHTSVKHSQLTGKVRTLKVTLGTVGNTVNALTGSTWKY